MNYVSSEPVDPEVRFARDDVLLKLSDFCAELKLIFVLVEIEYIQSVFFIVRFDL